MAAATQPTQQPDAARHVANIQRRLERWELTHLRALAASLHERIEELEANLERAHADAAAAWVEVDIWRDQTQSLIDDLQAAGREVGLTQTGELVTMPMAGINIDAVHQALEPLREAALTAINAAMRVTTADNGYDVREGGCSMNEQILPFRPPAPAKQPKTAVLWAPAGSGKSTNAQAIATLLGCSHIVDSWHWGKALEAGALHLTNASIQVGGAA